MKINSSAAKNSLKIVISLIFIFIVWKKINLVELIHILKNPSLFNFIFLTLVSHIIIVLHGVRLTQIAPDLRIRTVISATYISYFYGLFLPGQITTEFVRGGYLFRSRDRIAYGALVLTLDKLVSVFTVFLLSTVGLHFTTTPQLGIFRIIFLTASVSLCLVFFLLRTNFMNDFLKQLLSSIKLLNRLIPVLTCFQNMSLKRHLLTNFLFAILIQIFNVWTFYMLGLEFGAQLSFWDWSWINGALTIALLVPISFAGIGVREVGLIGLLGIFGISREIALTISIYIFYFYLSAAAVGYVCALRTSVAKSS
ncbi:MAG: flippase-like domain-containing protein [Bdellovibrionales bacterium]|nr:flippase-like domain-containing protein [Bdellovibrionales bacterium]